MQNLADEISQESFSSQLQVSDLFHESNVVMSQVTTICTSSAFLLKGKLFMLTKARTSERGSKEHCVSTVRASSDLNLKKTQNYLTQNLVILQT